MIENSNLKNKDFEEEINLKLIVNFVLRNKKFIGSISLIILLISFIIASFQKRIWGGKFEIVLEKNPSNLSSMVPDFGGFGIMGNFNLNSKLETEVGILESPSVLLPIFNFVKKEKEKKYPKEILEFTSWKNDNLSIELRRRTSILEINYIDKDADLILPVLTKISNAYQEYSGNSKRRSVALAKNYLSEQISLYKKNSSESIRRAQEYAMDKDLTVVDIGGVNINSGSVSKRMLNALSFSSRVPINALSSSPKASNLVSNFGIENKRVQASNKIRNIDKQIIKINEEKNLDNIESIFFTYPLLSQERIPELIQELEVSLIELKTKYKKNNILVKQVEEKKRILKETLKDRIISHLNAQKIIAEAQMEAAERPKGVVLKYKELMRQASRDENTLIALEDQLRSLELEAARSEDPWTLISDPEIFGEPVSDSILKKSFYGLLIGIFIGLIISFFKERQSDLIYEEEFLEKLLSSPILFNTSLNELEDNSYNDLNKKLTAPNLENIQIITLGINDSTIKENIQINFDKFKTNNKSISNRKLTFIEEFNQLNNTDTIFLVANLNITKKEDIKAFNKKIQFIKKTIAGIILLKI